MASQHANIRGSELVLGQLQLLITADDLGAFTAAHVIQAWPGSVPHHIISTTPAVAAGLTRAWANGLKLMLRDVRGSVLDAPAAALKAIDSLTIWLIALSKILVDGRGDRSLSSSDSTSTSANRSEQAHRLNAAQHMAKSGALQMFATFCSAAAADLHCRSEQQQQQLPLAMIVMPEAARLIGNSLSLWCSLYQWWPGKILEGSRGLAVTVKPVVALAAATLTTNATVEAAEYGISIGAASAIRGDTRQTESGLAVLAIRLGMSLLNAIEMQGFPNLTLSSAVPLVLELAAGDDTLLLFAAVLGSFTGCVWHQQQQENGEHLPEAYHAQLMQKLGCPALEFDVQAFRHPACPNKTEDIMRHLIRAITGVMILSVELPDPELTAQQQQQQLLQTASASDSHVTAEAAATEAAVGKGIIPVGTGGVTSGKLQEGDDPTSSNSSIGRRGLPAIELAMVFLELLVLLPADLELLEDVCKSVYVLERFKSRAPAPSSVSNPRINSWRLLEPLLFCMGPAVARLLQTSKEQIQQHSSNSSTPKSESSAGAAATDAVPGISPEQQMKEDFAGLLLTAIASGEEDAQGLEAAMLKQPEASISSLCLGMRGAAAAVIAGRQLAAYRVDAEPHLHRFAHIHACAHIIAAAVRAVVVQDSKGVCGSDGLIHVILSANAATIRVTASPQLQQQLFSLLLCCIKLAAQYKPVDAYHKMYGMLSTLVIAAAAAGMGCLLMRLPSTEAAAQPTSSSNNGRDRVAGSQPWLVLVARSLNIMGVSANSLMTMPGPDQASIPGAEQGSKRNMSRALAAGHVWQHMQQLSCEAIASLQSQQQLLAETHAAVQSDVGEGSPASGMAPAAEEQVLLQQQDVLKNALVNALEKVQGLCRIATNTNASITGSSSSNAEVLAQAELLLSQLGQQLQEAGAAVCAALPVPYCCNNPDCCSFRGESEQQPLSGEWQGVCVWWVSGGKVLWYRVPDGTLAAAQGSVQEDQEGTISGVSISLSLSSTGQHTSLDLWQVQTPSAGTIAAGAEHSIASTQV